MSLPSDERAREERNRARNRAALAWIAAACLVLAAAGYAFGRWLLAHPPQK